jgi:hypothetical protein
VRARAGGALLTSSIETVLVTILPGLSFADATIRSHQG